MKNTSKNPFFVHTCLEESECKIRSYKYLDGSECEITIRPESDFVVKDGKEVRTDNVAIFIGNEPGTIQAELYLTQREAKEFANYILDFVKALEADNDAS